MRVGVDMRRAPLLAVDVRAGRIAYMEPLENAVNPCEQRRLDGKKGLQGRVSARFFGRILVKRPFSIDYLPKHLPGISLKRPFLAQDTPIRMLRLTTLPLNPQRLLAHVLEAQVGVDVVRGRVESDAGSVGAIDRPVGTQAGR